MNDMIPLGKEWKIYVIQHSHTDIGYTDRQEKVEINHIDYIKQVLRIINDIKAGRKNEWKGFKWTCETFWPVEKFLENASDRQRREFEDAVTCGDIGLSATYVNLTELIDGEVLKNMTHRAVAYAESLGIKLNTAMTADINGYSWGYAQCMADLGVENLLSCVHAHHGMFPIGRKQYPFWWKTPGGQRILVWNGEHYHFANDLGLVPGAIGAYTIRDEFKVSYFEPNHQEIAEERIKRYLQQLESEEYPFDFIPLTVSGLLIDNAPPNGSIMEFINNWNDKFGGKIAIEMTTLKGFFNHVRSQTCDIPEYSGDWPDWWADGVASTPMATKFFRDAQRKYRIVRQLDPDYNVASREVMDRVEYDIMMYAEHTWGHSATAVSPWDTMVQAQELRKALFSYNAQDLIYRELDRVLAARGEATLSAGRPMRFKVINPYPFKVEDIAKLYLDNWELSYLKNEFEVVDLKTGGIILHQLCKGDISAQVNISVCMDKGEEREFIIRQAEEKIRATTESRQSRGIDGVLDIKGIWNPMEGEPIRVDENSLETPFTLIRWEEGHGIISWIDKSSKTEILRSDREYNAFTPVYEITPFTGSSGVRTTRVKMGRNRKGIGVRRYAGTLKGVEMDAEGPLFARVELKYELEGTSSYSLMLTAYSGIPRVDVIVRINKNDKLEPENVYIALPFTTGGEQKPQLWIEKTGHILRPRIDQLPGTGIDFYCIQEGITYTSGKKGIAIAMLDTPLIQLGPLEFGERQLMGYDGIKEDGEHLYSWPMNNYWETNFKGTIGGFYEFRYSVSWGKELGNPEAAIKMCHAINAGLIGFRVKEKTAF